MPKKAKKPAPETTSRSTTLVNQLKPKQTPEAAHAELVVAGLAINAVTALQFSKPFGDVDLTECLKALVDAAERVNRGDLGDAEALLMAQAVTLNAMFTQLANQSTQSQCRPARPLHAARPESSGPVPRDARNTGCHQEPADAVRAA